MKDASAIASLLAKVPSAGIRSLRSARSVIVVSEQYIISMLLAFECVNFGSTSFLEQYFLFLKTLR